MTNEEKAKEIANERCKELMCWGRCNIHKNHHCGYWHYNYECALKGIEYGLSEGRKENAELKEKIEKLKKNYKKQRNRRIDELQKENSIFKSIISTILDKDDICYICQMKGQVLPECMCMENSECLENMISLWSK